MFGRFTYCIGTQKGGQVFLSVFQSIMLGASVVSSLCLMCELD